ncbi:MAG: hypothetical protein IJW21_06280 [Clostridia bacterium]|nr:hypothetical protein [Clostridia bacterium]
MGCWGMGMAQSDEFCENYDNFMEEYDNGKAVAEITAGILAKYHAEFDDSDGVMHDVYFALAKAEWMCCEQSELVLNRVKEIIESGANIEFYRELEADEKNLIVRKRNLEKFLTMIKTPRQKPRKRKRTAPPVEKAFPPFETGDCFAYKYGNGYRVMCILERFKPKAEREQVTVVVFDGVYSAEELKTTDFCQEVMGRMFTVTADDFLGASVIRKVAHITVKPKSKERLLGVSAFIYGNKGSFRSEINESLYITLNEFFYHCEENTQELFDSLEVSGCYAYKYKDGYKFAVVLDNLTLDETEYRLIAILSPVLTTPTVDFLNSNISSFTMYDKDALPNLRDWQKVTTIEVPKNMQRKCFGKSRYIISGIFDFLQDRSSLQNQRSAFQTLAPLLEVCRDNSQESLGRLEAGGCYAFAANGGYKIVIILNRFNSHGADHFLVAVLWRTFLAPEVDYMSEGISHIGIYTADTLPNIDGWSLNGRLELPSSIKEHIDKFNVVTTESILKFFASPPYYSGTVTLNNYLRTYFPNK